MTVPFDKANMTIFQSISATFSKPNIKVRTNFFRLMAISLEVGLGLRESVINIINTERNATMKSVLQDIVNSLSEGESFAEAMSYHPSIFSPNEVELVRAAETMGNLPEIMRQIAKEMENLQKIYQRIRSAVTYPIVLIFFSVLAVIILLLYVIPTIIELFPDTERLPSITLFMLSVSDFLRKSWYLIIVGLGGALFAMQIAYNWLLPVKKIIDKIMISMPVLGEVTQSFYMYRFCRLLGDFTHAGVPTVRAFSQMRSVFSNYYYKRKTYEILKDMEAGFSLGDAIEGSELFDSLLIQVIIVGEETGNLAEVLISMSDFYKEKFRVTIDVLMGFLEPVLMVLVAAMIGLIVASIYLPIADLVNVIGQ